MQISPNHQHERCDRKTTRRSRQKNAIHAKWKTRMGIVDRLKSSIRFARPSMSDLCIKKMAKKKRRSTRLCLHQMMRTQRSAALPSFT